jgi:uncharacterized protein YndB with AHSA1/START domain
VAEIPGTTALVRHLLPAPPDVVYDEWLDTGALADWMCPRPARCRGIQSDPRVGGRLRIDVEEEGTEFSITGEYLVLDRPGQLSFTWSCSTWPDPGLRSVVTVLLEPREGGQTLMTVRHTLLPPGLAAQHARGWAAIAGQLAAKLSAGPAGGQVRYRRDGRERRAARSGRSSTFPTA